MARASGGPSPRDDARRRGWDEPQARRSVHAAEEPWLDEGDAYEEGPSHTLIGRRMLFGLLFLLGVLTIGVVVGIGLVSKREDTPIDVPAIGEEVPVLASPGPWKLPPTGPDVDGVPVEGQGQVLFGTGDGQETEAEIDLDSMPEDPLPRPGTDAEALSAVDEALGPDAGQNSPEAARIAPPPAPPPAPTPPKAARPVDVVTPRDATVAVERAAVPRPVEAPRAAPSVAGVSGQTVQLGAFSSQARARAAFKSLAERYSYLAGMEPVVVPVAADGKTLYRLRASAGSPTAARDICGRLRVAGEACSVVE